MSKAIIVIFIEGETEIAFYKKIIKYIEERNSFKREHYKIIPIYNGIIKEVKSLEDILIKYAK